MSESNQTTDLEATTNPNALTTEKSLKSQEIKRAKNNLEGSKLFRILTSQKTLKMLQKMLKTLQKALKMLKKMPQKIL